MWYLIKKENLVLLKSWSSYFLTLFTPVMYLLINILVSSAVAHIEITVIDPSKTLAAAIQAEAEKQGKVSYDIVIDTDLQKAIVNIQNKKTEVVLEMDANNYIHIYYDGGRQDSMLAMQVAGAMLQKLNTDAMQEHYPQMVESYNEKQLFKVNETDNVGLSSVKASGANSLLIMSLIWIFIFCPLNLSTTQIQIERSLNTYFYLFKIPKNKAAILFSKQTAVILQCVLSLIILLCMAKLLGMLNVDLDLIYIPIIIVIVLSISSIGYFLGFILKDSSLSVVFSLLLTLPTMLITSLKMNTVFDPLLKFIPTHYASQLIKEILTGEPINEINIVILAIFFVLFFTASIFLFVKKDPMKMCTTR